MPASSLLNSWNAPAMMVPGKLGLFQLKVKVLELASAEAVMGGLGGTGAAVTGFLFAGVFVAVFFPGVVFSGAVVSSIAFSDENRTGAASFPLPITTMWDGTVTLMVAVNRLTPYPATGNQSPEYSR